MRDRENREQFGRTSTEASKGFIRGWKDVLMTGSNIAGTYVGIDMASKCLAQGQNEAALLWGVMAGCGVAATVLRGASMYIDAKEKIK